MSAEYRNAFQQGYSDAMRDFRQEPKIGHWILGICDNCGYNWGKDAPIASVPNFCPNCGYHMVEPQEERGGEE